MSSAPFAAALNNDVKMTESNYATAVPMSTQGDTQSNNLMQGANRPHRGHRCCGGCCDMRRAVIIVNIVQMIMSVIGTATILGMRSQADEMAANMNDDAAAATMTEFGSMPAAPMIIVALVMMLFNVAGIMGAVNYNSCLVIVAAISYLPGIVLNLMSFNIFGIILPVCFLYPHVVFINELRAGIMTKDNYANEAYSCCCV